MSYLEMNAYCQAQLKPIPKLGLSSSIITLGHLSSQPSVQTASYPEKYNFLAMTMLGSSVATWELL